MMITLLFGFCIFQNLVFFRISVCSAKMSHRFTVEYAMNREYRRFNAIGTQLSLRQSPPPHDSYPVTHFLDSMSNLFEYALRNCNDSYMVGVTVSNEVSEQYKPIGINFRRKVQLSGQVIWSVFEKVAQWNAKFNARTNLSWWSIRLECM